MPKGIDGVADGLDALDELLELRDVEPVAAAPFPSPPPSNENRAYAPASSTGTPLRLSAFVKVVPMAGWLSENDPEGCQNDSLFLTRPRASAIK